MPPGLQRAFVKFPNGVAHLDATPALDTDRERLQPYFGKSDQRVVIANLSPEELSSAEGSGGQVYSDIVFQPAAQLANPFDFAPQSRFWDVAAEPALSSPQPWLTKALPDVLSQVNVNGAWGKTKGAGVTVVIVDSGLNGSAGEFSLSRRSSLSFSPAFPDGPFSDKLGHGSMVASIAIGSVMAGGKFDGVAPEATILSARTTYAASDLYAIYDHLISLKNSGQLPGAVVVNNSYQLTQCNPDGRLPKDHPYADVIRTAVQAGFIMVFAAGNNHADMLCSNDPSSCSPNTIWAVNSLDEVITVGAVNWDGSNKVGAHANSSRGPGEWSSAFPKPDCVAPCYGQVLFGQDYRILEWWGTSGAAPVVSGAVALVVARANAKGLAVTPAMVAQIIRQTSRPIAGSAKTCTGYGLIDCAAAVDAI